MNTTAAAAQAKVTVATVRTWCRIGAVAAVKQAGRWVVDAASLAARIAIGKMKRPARPVILTPEALVAIGGRRWQKNGKDRVYINDWTEFAGLETSHYGTGSISSAAFRGRTIANGRADSIASAIGSLYYDVTDGRFYGYWGQSAREFEIRYKDGERETVDLVDLTIAGIRGAVAAL
jgi:hypothetical protein